MVLGVMHLGLDLQPGAPEEIPPLLLMLEGRVPLVLLYLLQLLLGVVLVVGLEQGDTMLVRVEGLGYEGEAAQVVVVEEGWQGLGLGGVEGRG